MGRPKRLRYGTTASASSSAAIHRRDRPFTAPRNGYGESSVTRPPSSSSNFAPARASRYGMEATGAGRRTSTTQKFPGIRVDRWIANVSPFSALPVNAALRVPLVLTTSRSPAASHRGSSLKVECASVSASACETSRRTPSRLTPRASGGSAASRWAGSVNECSITPAAATAHPPAGRRTVRRERPVDPDRRASSRTGS